MGLVVPLLSVSTAISGEEHLVSIDWGPVGRLIEKNRRFVVTSHANPEADAAGSQVALARYLQGLSKSVRMVSPSPTPESCRFLDPDGEIVLFDPGRASALLGAVDLVFILDLSSWKQLGSFADHLRSDKIQRVCIDHHKDPDEDIAQMIVRDDTAAATGVLIYEMIQALGGEMTPAIVQALYAALATDTGSFRFANTDARALRIGADLVEAGAKPESIYRKVFENRRWAAVKLLPAVFSTLGRSANGALAWVHITREMLAEAGGRYDDTDSYIDLLRAIKGVEVCAIFKEGENGIARVSLRSTGSVDVQRFARSFGGGGHTRAAGLSFEGTVEEAIGSVIAGLEMLVRTDG